MAALQPFDRHPADPAALGAASATLATDADTALHLAEATTRAYAPVPGSWHGTGGDEAVQAAAAVTARAHQASAAVATAAVALAAWAEAVRQFNAEVDRIVAEVAAAGTGPGAKELTQTEMLQVKAAAQRRGEARWQVAYDTYIVTGREQAVRILQRGPTDTELLALFQAGLLPMSMITLYPGVDFSHTDWQRLFANLRAHGTDPLSWAALGSYDPAELAARLRLMRAMGVPPVQYKNLLQLYWVATAAQKAGIDLSQWDPNRGADALKDIIIKVYEYYGRLYLQHPYLQWAGMANMIGPSFAGGFFDLAMIRRIAGALEGQPGVPFDTQILANLSDQDLKFFESTFLGMQKNIFYDQAMMHEAYLTGGMPAIDELRQAGLINEATELAWQQIDTGQRTGNPALVSSGNMGLLEREQHYVIDGDYQRMYNHPVSGPAFTYLMTAIGEPSIPGAHSFADFRPLVVSIETPGPERVPFVGWDNPLQGEIKIKTPLPDGNIAHYDDRWAFITHDTLPAYQSLLRDHPDQAAAIIGSDVAGRVEDYRIGNRIEHLVWKFATDWSVDFEQ